MGRKLGQELLHGGDDVEIEVGAGFDPAAHDAALGDEPLVFVGVKPRVAYGVGDDLPCRFPVARRFRLYGSS